MTATPGLESIVLVREMRPGQVIRVTLLTPEQAKHLPAMPAGALQVIFDMRPGATIGTT